MQQMTSPSAADPPTQCLELCGDPARVAAGRDHLLPETTFVEVAEIFRTLGDATRAKIVFSLMHQPLCTCDLAALTGITASAISQHLRLLRALRLVKSRRQGKQVYHTLKDDHVALLVQVGVSHVRDGDAQHPAMRHLLTLLPVSPPAQGVV